MKSEKQLKTMVKEKYAKIVGEGVKGVGASCCGYSSTTEDFYNIMSEEYTSLQGYAKEADLGLGCGLPTKHAHIKSGNTVIDLGSGAGNDCFVARHQTGSSGKVIGIDFTPAMIKRARANAEKLGFNNVEFREGDIDQIPVGDNVADVIVSNCVLNLVPNKKKVFEEIYRVLKPGGHFSISDIVLNGQLPEAMLEAAEMYAGCISGAIQKEEYLRDIENAGFIDSKVQKERKIQLPIDLMGKYLSEEAIKSFEKGETGIYSITVYGVKPEAPISESQGITDEVNSVTCNPASNCC